MSAAVAPFGSWSSPVTGESFTARSVTLSQVRVDGPDVYWIEGHPKEGGRSVLLRRQADGVTSEILPLIEGSRLVDVRTTVHEFGGRAYAVRQGIIVFSDGTDARLYLYDANDPTSSVRPLTPLEDTRYGDLEIDEVRGLVYAVREDHREPGEPLNSIVAVPLDGSAARDGERVRTVVAGDDFVMAPEVSPDGTKLAWISWDHPDMPWTRSALHVASLTFTGEIRRALTLVDAPEVCVYEPRWTLTGDLVHVDDSTGWANLYRTEGFHWAKDEDPDAWVGRLRTRALHPAAEAFSQPHWRLGLHSFDNLDEQTLVCSWAEGSTWHIGTVRLDNGLQEEWHTDWWPVGNVVAAEGRVVYLGDSPTRSAAIIEVRDGRATPIRPSTEAEVSSAMISPAKPVSWRTRDGEVAHGFYYAPHNPGFEAPRGELPPLIVNAHSGPTSAARCGLDVEYQFWTTRGFAVLDVNYRGSTGYGRAYRERLVGNWGVIDVQDCEDGVRELVSRGLADPKRVAIRGADAGGFTALRALATTDTFSAGTSVCGAADLRSLVHETPKFLSRYTSRLLGTSDLEDPVWDDRSPLRHVEQVRAPLLLMQGEDDTIVPPSQSRAIYQALRSRGLPVALLSFAGEGHGFRRAESIRRAWESELGFYAKVWNIDAKDAADLHVDNL